MEALLAKIEEDSKNKRVLKYENYKIIGSKGLDPSDRRRTNVYLGGHSCSIFFDNCQIIHGLQMRFDGNALAELSISFTKCDLADCSIFSEAEDTTLFFNEMKNVGRHNKLFLKKGSVYVSKCKAKEIGFSITSAQGMFNFRECETDDFYFCLSPSDNPFENRKEECHYTSFEQCSFLHADIQSYGVSRVSSYGTTFSNLSYRGDRSDFEADFLDSNKFYNLTEPEDGSKPVEYIQALQESLGRVNKIKFLTVKDVKIKNCILSEDLSLIRSGSGGRISIENFIFRGKSTLTIVDCDLSRSLLHKVAFGADTSITASNTKINGCRFSVVDWPKSIRPRWPLFKLPANEELEQVRENFRQIKASYVKENDPVMALTFYVHEMNTLYLLMKRKNWIKNFEDKFILLVSKYGSWYGTSLILPIFWWSFFNFLITNHYLDPRTYLADPSVPFDFFINLFFSVRNIANNKIPGTVMIERYLSTALNGIYCEKLAEPKLRYSKSIKNQNIIV